MITITIDTSDLAEFEANLIRAQGAHFPNARKELVLAMEMLRLDWIGYVEKDLHFQEYADELRKIPVIYPFEGNDMAAAAMGGPVASRMEYGTTAWDIKPGLLNGKMVHTGGPDKHECVLCGKVHYSRMYTRFVNVPFRHATPDTLGRVGAIMPKEIHKMAKKLDAYTADFQRNQRLKPPRVGMKPHFAERGQRTQFRIPPHQPSATGMTHVNPLSKGGFATYTWKTGLYNDMVKSTKGTPGGGKHVQYMTWRRVSINSDPNSWWYPAIAARPALPRVVAENEERIRRMVRYGLAVDMGLVPTTLQHNMGLNEV